MYVGQKKPFSKTQKKRNLYKLEISTTLDSEIIQQMG
jgi:hypothetical protein